MKYYSTASRKSAQYTLSQASMLGLAPDGGLFMPCTIPTIDMMVAEREAEKSFAHLAYYLAEKFFGEDMDRDVLRDVVFDAFDFPITLARTGALELFNGPTLAFKDFGARFMARMLDKLRTRDMVILTATSGDTGSAVAAGFWGMSGIRVVVLYPEGRVSDFQERQMTTLGSNIEALSVRGSFDDCQRVVKSIFADHDFCRENGITSANSISILRWIPQLFYYFYGYYLWKRATGAAADKKPVVVVPSGNFGNITAGILAVQMGLPVERFVAATNANDTIPQFLATGVYRAKSSVTTISNAMDVGDPSNYQRLMALCGNDTQRVRRALSSVSYTDDQTRQAIVEIYEKYGYVSDPHSAIGYLALRDEVPNGIDDGFYLSTAHPAKFGHTIEQCLGFEPKKPALMERYYASDKLFTTIEADVSSVRKFLILNS